MWYSSHFTREDLVGRLRDLKPNKGFRSAYQYNPVPGQPPYELVRRKQWSFDVKGRPGFSVDFQTDASGKVTEAVFNQPNGVFRPKRK